MHTPQALPVKVSRAADAGDGVVVKHRCHQKRSQGRPQAARQRHHCARHARQPRALQLGAGKGSQRQPPTTQTKSTAQVTYYRDLCTRTPVAALCVPSARTVQAARRWAAVRGDEVLHPLQHRQHAVRRQTAVLRGHRKRRERRLLYCRRVEERLQTNSRTLRCRVHRKHRRRQLRQRKHAGRGQGLRQRQAGSPALGHPTWSERLNG